MSINRLQYKLNNPMYKKTNY